MTPPTHAPEIELMAAILAETPTLPGAACVGEVDLFDAAADGDRDAAELCVEICTICPVLATCREWITRAYPKRPPPGVWAGHHQRTKNTRKKETA